jgi:orotidine-5'-phosphate decarboxylase
VGFRDRLATSSKVHHSRVVLALDVIGPQNTRPQRAAKVLRDLAEEIAAVKINFQLLLPRGLEGIAEVASICSEKGLPLIADIKLNDIESTNLEAVELLFGNGVDAVIANPFVGFDEGLSRVVHKARALEKGVILLVYMSHAGAKEGYGLIVDGEPLYLEFARRVRDWDADGAIVSSKSLKTITQVRKILGKERVIISPGVGTQGGESDKAVKAGSDFLIIGRSIIDSEGPLKALQEFNRSTPPP